MRARNRGRGGRRHRFRQNGGLPDVELAFEAFWYDDYDTWAIDGTPTDLAGHSLDEYQATGEGPTSWTVDWDAENGALIGSSDITEGTYDVTFTAVADESGDPKKSFTATVNFTQGMGRTLYTDPNGDNGNGENGDGENGNGDNGNGENGNGENGNGGPDESGFPVPIWAIVLVVLAAGYYATTR